ncbi:MAG TPA: Rrf2 family transcriptional regulator [Bryobacteraceae bacterium]|nr:Rrf2 family transcriptional regulator [Bryobacteraceae bacterium]
MIYSRSAEYAIRALIRMAELEDGEYALVKQIAVESDIPAHFLAKILQDLARLGFLKSSKGPGGGFRLDMDADEISMLQIVEAVDGAGRYDRCPGGHAECSDRVPCGLHDSWIPLRSRIIEYLEGTSVADLQNALGEKRRQLARQRRRGHAK